MSLGIHSRYAVFFACAFIVLDSRSIVDLFLFVVVGLIGINN